ncbi:MAG TPA: DUF4129 domain-containing protein [Pirellulales bacterium]|nr:DUF4129 domain-containing protein [Pirellulales bacterium]
MIIEAECQIENPMRRHRRLLAAVLALLVAVASAGVGAADEEAVETGREALRSEGFPWYDSSIDDVRRITPTAPRTTQGNTGNSGWDFFVDGDWLTPLAWIGITTLLGILGFFLIRAYLIRERSRAIDEGSRSQESVADVVDRVEQLPVQVRRPASDFLTAARDLYQQGNYSEAIIYLYSHLLLQLDKRDLIRLTKGKTNRQYMREVRRWSDLRGLVETAMVLFEDAFFGKRKLERDRFEAVWNRLKEFEMLVEQASAS